MLKIKRELKDQIFFEVDGIDYRAQQYGDEIKRIAKLTNCKRKEGDRIQWVNIAGGQRYVELKKMLLGRGFQ